MLHFFQKVGNAFKPLEFSSVWMEHCTQGDWFRGNLEVLKVRHPNRRKVTEEADVSDHNYATARFRIVKGGCGDGNNEFGENIQCLIYFFCNP